MENKLTPLGEHTLGTLLDPAARKEDEVAELRESCREILGELERRYDERMRIPRELSRRSVQLRHACQTMVREHPFLVFASVTFVMAGMLTLGHARPARRYLR